MKKKLRSLFVGRILTRFAIRIQLVLLILLIGLSVSAQLQLVKDINTLPSGEGPLPEDEHFTRLTPVNGSLFFVLYESELWKTESTSLHASFIKEFVRITNLVNVNGTLFFAGDRGETGLELWKSDGTPAGTVLVKDIRPGTEGSSPTELTNVDGTVYFSAHDGSTGRELWKSDGTAEGTVRVKDIMRVVGSSNPANLINKDGLLLFTVNDGQRGYELWKSDGTETGTTLVKDIRPEHKVSSSPQQLTNVNGTIFFTALVARGVRNLFKSDGTEAGTVEVSNVSSDYRLLTNVNGTLFFAGRDPAHGLELWKSDGTAAGTVLVKDLTPGPGSSTAYSAPHLSHFRSINNKLFFLAVTPGPGIYSATESLWVSDGTASGTEKLTEFEDISFSFIDPFLTPFAGMAYFTATTNDGLSLLRTDGTPEGEEIFIENIASGHTSEAKLTVVDNYLYYVGNGSIWKTDGVTTNAVSSGYEATRDSNPQYITDANGVVYFAASGNTSHGLYKSDGTDAGTLLVHNFPERVTDLTISGGNLYYMANYFDYDGGIDGWKLWKTDLLTGASTWVSDINQGEDDYITDLTDVNGTLYFAVQSMAGEGQLWKTSGTLASTQHVKTFNTLANPPIFLTNVNGTLFFAASTDEWGNDLWKSDGTEAGTVLVNEINSTPEEPSDPFGLTSADNMLFFIAYNGYDYELYKSDGTEAGTVMVKDIRVDDHNEFDINELTYINGVVYFVAIGEQDESGNYERDVWKSDGTESGTVKIATLPARYDAPFISGLHILDVVNGKLVLGLQDASGNNELWTTNETETVKIADLPGLANANYFDDVAVRNNIIYFTGQTGYGSVLWRTDGSNCGSFSVVTEGNPADLTLSNDQIFLAYKETSEYGVNTRFGRELYIIDESEINVPCEAMVIAASAGRVDIFENPEGESNQKAVANYPNPFTVDFVLNVDGEEGGFFDVKISDLHGKAIGKYNQLLYKRDYMLGSGWMPGVYVLHVKKDNMLITKKIIKTR